MNYSKLTFLTLPYVRLELIGWGKILKTLGVYRDELWESASVKTIRGKLHGYLMTLNLSNWSERQTYFLGRYYDLPTQLFLQATVRTGDTFVDIGANIGMVTLLAAYHVGEQGKVYAFEPNPKVFERLNAIVIKNQLRQVECYQYGLAEKNTKLTLNVINEYAELGSFAPVPQKDLSMSLSSYQVPVYRGDEILHHKISKFTFIKIDVEGFEPYVIRGLSNIISNFQPIIIMEIVTKHLERANSSVEQIWQLMENQGYEAFQLGSKRFRLQHHLQLNRISPCKNMRGNFVWIHPNSSLSERLRNDDFFPITNN